MRKTSLNVTLCAALTGLTLASCRSKDNVQGPSDEYSTDQMWSDVSMDETLLAFAYEDSLYTPDYMYELKIYEPEPRDGGFYRLTADVKYINGGVAGYYNYPEIIKLHKMEEISPYEFGLPGLEEYSYGLLLIGDYADGDILLNTNIHRAVWKDGEWIWKYKRQVTLDDGRKALTAEDTTKEEAAAGAEAGILSCAEYFILPAE